MRALAAVLLALLRGLASANAQPVAGPTRFNRNEHTADCTIALAPADGSPRTRFSCDGATKRRGGGCSPDDLVCSRFGWDREGCLSESGQCAYPQSRPEPPYVDGTDWPDPDFPCNPDSSAGGPGNAYLANAGGNLTITILEMRNLPNTDTTYGAFSAETDAYARVTVYGRTQTTSTVDNSLNPKWGRNSIRDLSFGPRRSGRSIEIKVMDADSGFESSDDVVGVVDTSVIFCSRFTAQRAVVQDCEALGQAQCIGAADGGNCVWQSARRRCEYVAASTDDDATGPALAMKGAWEMPEMKLCTEEAWLPLRPPVGQRADFTMPESCTEASMAAGAACVRVRQTVVPFDVHVDSVADASKPVKIGLASSADAATITAFKTALTAKGCDYSHDARFGTQIERRFGRPWSSDAEATLTLKNTYLPWSSKGLFGGLLLQTDNSARGDVATASVPNYARVSVNMPATLHVFHRRVDVFAPPAYSQRSAATNASWLASWDGVSAKARDDSCDSPSCEFVGFSKRFDATQRDAYGVSVPGTDIALGYTRLSANVPEPQRMYFAVAVMEERMPVESVSCSTVAVELAALFPTFAQFFPVLFVLLILWWRFLNRIGFRLDRVSCLLVQHKFMPEQERNIVAAAFLMYNDSPQNRDFRRNLHYATNLVYLLASAPFWILWTWGISAMLTAKPRALGFALIVLGTAALCAAFAFGRWSHSGWRMTREVITLFAITLSLVFVFLIGNIFVHPCPPDFFNLTAVFMALNALPMVWLAYASDTRLVDAHKEFSALVADEKKIGDHSSHEGDSALGPFHELTKGCCTVAPNMPTFNRAGATAAVFATRSKVKVYCASLIPLLAYVVICAIELPDEMSGVVAVVACILVTDSCAFLLKRGSLSWGPTTLSLLVFAVRASMALIGTGRFWLLGVSLALMICGIMISIEIVRKRWPRLSAHSSAQTVFFGRTNVLNQVNDVTASPEFALFYLSFIFVGVVIAVVLAKPAKLPLPSVRVYNQEWEVWVFASIAFFAMLIVGILVAATNAFDQFQKGLLSSQQARVFCFVRSIKVPFVLVMAAELLIVCVGLFLFGATSSSFILITSIFAPIIFSLSMMIFLRWRANDYTIVVWPPAEELLDSDDEDISSVLPTAESELFALPLLSKDGSQGDAAPIISMPSLPLKSAVREQARTVVPRTITGQQPNADGQDWRAERSAWRRRHWMCDFWLRFLNSLVPSVVTQLCARLFASLCCVCRRHTTRAKVTPGALDDSVVPAVDFRRMSRLRAFCEGYLLDSDYATIGAFVGLLGTIAAYGAVLFFAVEPQWIGIAIWVGLYVIIFTIAPFVKYFNSYIVTLDMILSWIIGFASLVVGAALIFVRELGSNVNSPHAFQLLSVVVLYPTVLLFGACWYQWSDRAWRPSKFVTRGLPCCFLVFAVWIAAIFVWEGATTGIPFAIVYALLLATVVGIRSWVEFEFYLPPQSQRIANLAMITAAWASLVCGLLLKASSLFYLTVTFFFLGAKYSLQALALQVSRPSGTKLFFSPYIFPVFSYKPHLDRVEEENAQFQHIYRVFGVALLWSVSCIVFVDPMDYGTGCCSAILVLLCITSCHYMSITPIIIGHAALSVTKSMVVNAASQARSTMASRRLQFDVICQEWEEKEKQEAEYEAELARLTHGSGDADNDNGGTDFLKQIDDALGGAQVAGANAQDNSEAMAARKTAVQLARIIEDCAWSVQFEEDTDGKEVRRFDGVMTWQDAMMDALLSGRGPLAFLRYLCFPFPMLRFLQRRFCCKKRIERSAYDNDGSRRILDMRPLSDTRKHLLDLLEADVELAYEYAEEIRYMTHIKMLATVCAEATIDRETVLFQKFLRESRFKLMSNGINPPKEIFRTQSYASIDIAHVAVWILGLTTEERERFHELKARYTEEVALRDIMIDDEDAQRCADAAETRAKQVRREELMCRRRYQDFRARRERREEEGSAPQGKYDEALVNAQEEMVEIESGWSCSPGSHGRDTQFNDADFKPGADALGNASCVRDIVGWREAKSICAESALFANGTDPDDVYQGRFQNGWLLSALSIVAASGGVDNGEVDELVDALFITKKISEVGAYQLRLWLNGQWETVTVDDFFPVLSNDNRDLPCAGAAGAYSLQFREIWVALVEKAVAKYYGSYANIEKGDVAHALTMFTGAESHEVLLAQESRGAKKETLWDNMVRWRGNGFLLGAGTVTADNADHEIQDSGLVFGACYCVYDVVVVDGHRLIRMRNPPGDRAEWRGDWNDNSATWTRRLKVLAGWADAADNTFWISFDDFCHAFRSLYVCHHFNPRHWPARVFHGEWTEDFAAGLPTRFNKECALDNNTQYTLTLFRPTQVCITLSQVDHEGLAAPEVHPIALYVVQHVAKDRAMRVKELNTRNIVASSGDVVRQRSVKCYCLLEPRAYTILCATFLRGMEGPFKVTVQSNFPVKIGPLWPAAWKDGDEPKVVAVEMTEKAAAKKAKKEARKKKKHGSKSKGKQTKENEQDIHDEGEDESKNDDAMKGSGATCQWVKQWDSHHSKFYYYNTNTNISVWDEPPDFVEGTTDSRLDAATRIQSRFRGNRSRRKKNAQKQSFMLCSVCGQETVRGNPNMREPLLICAGGCGAQVHPTCAGFSGLNPPPDPFLCPLCET